ncbi:unnamed protein product [Discosporangium mesarthrocarpum]
MLANTADKVSDYPVISRQWEGHDDGEDRLIEEYGPHGVKRMQVDREMGEGVPTAVNRTFGESEVDLVDLLDRPAQGPNHGLSRVLYDPTELARALQPERRQISGGVGEPCAMFKGSLMERLGTAVVQALDPARPNRESLLLCKAVTDACLVNARWLRPSLVGDGGYLIYALQQAWRVSIEVEKNEEDPLSAADLQSVASWFQAWGATDDIKSGGEPILISEGLDQMLPGGWIWVLDHLEMLGRPEGVNLDDMIEEITVDQKKSGAKQEQWGLSNIVDGFLAASDEEWFREGGGLSLDFEVEGPSCLTTFLRTFYMVPGAIYGGLKDSYGFEYIPPAFRMYTTGDIEDALGERALCRVRKDVHGVVGSCSDAGGGRGREVGHGSNPAVEVASLVEVQVTWVQGKTHVMGWVDCLRCAEEDLPVNNRSDRGEVMGVRRDVEQC